MRWRTEFYNERQGIMARYGVEASTAAAAVLVGKAALVAEYPAKPVRRPRSWFEQAQRVGGQDPSGWVLYRIVKASDGAA